MARHSSKQAGLDQQSYSSYGPLSLAIPLRLGSVSNGVSREGNRRSVITPAMHHRHSRPSTQSTFVHQFIRLMDTLTAVLCYQPTTPAMKQSSVWWRLQFTTLENEITDHGSCCQRTHNVRDENQYLLLTNKTSTGRSNVWRPCSANLCLACCRSTSLKYHTVIAYLNNMSIAQHCTRKCRQHKHSFLPPLKLFPCHRHSKLNQFVPVLWGTEQANLVQFYQ